MTTTSFECFVSFQGREYSPKLEQWLRERLVNIHDLTYDEALMVRDEILVELNGGVEAPTPSFGRTADVPPKILQFTGVCPEEIP